MSTVYEIDGTRFSTLEGFFEEVSHVILAEADWGRNLDAFNDILRGGFGTPEEGFTIRWKNHALSQERLGYPETVRQLKLRLRRCHASNRAAVAADLAEAEREEGLTVFDWIVDIIRRHGASGEEADQSVSLVLE
jgi:RNAse (barnase) inhibitor barstar